MKYTTVALLVFVHTVLVGAQFITVDTFINGNDVTTDIPGGNFALDIDVDMNGFANTQSTCIFDFPSATVLSSGAAAGCTDLGMGVSWECTIDWILAGSTNDSTQSFTPISGTAGFPACAGDSWFISYNCSNPGTGGDQIDTDTFTLTESTVLLESDVYSNDVNATIDYNTDEFFSIIYSVRNVNDCPADGVQCDLTFPARFNSEEDPGLVEFILDDPATTVALPENNCILEGLTFTCPQDESTAFSFALNETKEIGAAFQLTGNGTLVFSIQCNATLLSDIDLATASIEFEGINVPAPEDPGFTSDDSDDLIVNTVIPLAIFVCIMVILCVFIWAGVIGYIIYSKATADESF